MKNYHLYLLGLLAVQIVIVFSLYTNESKRLAASETKPFVVINSDNITKVLVKDGSQTVDLVKNGDHWLIPSLNNLPVTKNKMEDNLNAIMDISVSWPIATTSSAKERFEVSEENFQRYVELFDGEKSVSKFYLGSSPSFRKVHARRDNENDVFAISFNTFDLPVKADQWLDKSLLSTKNIKSIKGDSFELIKGETVWYLSGGTPEKAEIEVDQEKATTLADTFNTLRIQNVQLEPLKFGDSKTSNIEVVTDEGTLSYQFIEMENNYYVKRGDLNQMFTISKFNYEKLANTSIDSLITAPEEDTPRIENQIDIQEVPEKG